MAQPVVHFEVVGKDSARLRDYFPRIFGWSFAVPSPVVQEVSAPDDYGFLDLITTEDGTDIHGGVGGGPGYKSHAVFYVGVPDAGAALQRAGDLVVVGSWVPSRHPMDSLSVISRTLKAP